MNDYYLEERKELERKIIQQAFKEHGFLYSLDIPYNSTDSSSPYKDLLKMLEDD